jgi:alkylation response protein AidB-like acyl-CoA dehydrogenase
MTNIEATKLIVYKSFYKYSAGLPNVKESAMAKPIGVPSAFNAIYFAIRVLGKLGYTSEYDVGQRLLDVLSWYFGDGSLEACKMVVARELGDRDFLPY